MFSILQTRPLKTCRVAAGLLLFSSAAALLAAAPVNAGRPDSPSGGRFAELAAKMPLRFEQNLGQLRDTGVAYFARGLGYRLSLTPEEAIFELGGARAAGTRLSLRLAGAAAHPSLSGIDPLPTRSHYLLGNDPRAWHTGVASFKGVRYQGVYPGTDLVFSGEERQVEQSFYLAAGADPGRIRLVYEGATTVAVGRTGDLVVGASGADLKADRPVAYQLVQGERRPVLCRYEVRSGKNATEVGFALGAYDRTLPLVIDPIFSNSTFLGGSDDDIGRAVAVDGSGNVYVAGSTASIDLLGASGPGGVGDSNNGGAYVGFVMKVDPTGTHLLYSTYLGGSDVDEIYGIAVDAAGDAYVTGYTLSTDFPTVSSTLSYRGNGDAFVAKLNPTGSALLYSTYLGGTDDDFGNGIAVDATGNAYVTGTTGSRDFPGTTAASLQQNNRGGHDAFLVKLSLTGALVYSTYFGGSGEDSANAIALDPSGKIVLAGSTCSADLPITVGAVATVSLGTGCLLSRNDAFVAKLNPAGTGLVYSTYLGGAGNDVAFGVAVDASGNAYVVGETNSSTFTGVTAGSFQPTHSRGYAAFVTRINAAGSAVAYSTFLGGSGSSAFGVAVDAAANAYVTGSTVDGFPVVNASNLQDTSAGDLDGFVTEITPTGSVVYSTYFGGSGTDGGYAIAVDSSHNAVYVTGASCSSTLPGIGPSSIQSADAGGAEDAFLVRLVSGYDLRIAATASTTLVDPGRSVTYTLTANNTGAADASGVTMTDVVPANTTFDPTTSTPGWSCLPSNAAGSTCILAVGLVHATQTPAAIFVAKLNPRFPAGAGPIQNVACVRPGSACATLSTPMTAAAVLSISTTAVENTKLIVKTLTYTIHVSNTGNQDAAFAVLTDQVPAGLVLDPTELLLGWPCLSVAGSLCRYNVGTLAAGASLTVSLIFDLLPFVPSSTIITNTACLQAAGTQGELTGRAASVIQTCTTTMTALK
jgi:uncharacterized repeat protein (TIGR01451 family)